MSIVEILLLGVSLSMDAFAVSICQGLCLPKFSLKHMLVIGLWYGAFQTLMPIIGFLLSSRCAGMIESFDHWIAFALLVMIGFNMIRESLKKEENTLTASLAFFTMLKLAIATSIDALAVGVSLAMLQKEIFLPAVMIGCTTFTISAVGVVFGKAIGEKLRSKAAIVGGVILIGLGLKILLEHTLLK
ncbi:manganese efflux pump [bacterium]|nr:manganese efflux pump [bacterium]